MKINKNRSGDIVDYEYTLEEREAMKREVKNQLLEFMAENLLEIEAIFLMQLKEQLGFGKKRLRKFYDNFNPTIYELMIKHLNNKDQTSCILYLKNNDCPIDEWALEREGVPNE